MTYCQKCEYGLVLDLDAEPLYFVDYKGDRIHMGPTKPCPCCDGGKNYYHCENCEKEKNERPTGV